MQKRGEVELSSPCFFAPFNKMVRALLLRFTAPRLHRAVRALKGLRELVYCLAQPVHDARRIEMARARLTGVFNGVSAVNPSQKNIQFMRGAEQIMRLAEKNFRELHDYRVAVTEEAAWFFSVYISLLSTLAGILTGPSRKRGEEAAKAAGFITAARKQLRLFRAGRSSRSAGFIDGLKLASLYTDFDRWLDEAEKLLENIISDTGIKK